MKQIFGILTATILALATLGAPAYAISEDELAGFAAATEQGLEAATAYIAENDEKVVVFTGSQAQRFNEGMSLFAGKAAPVEAVTFIYGDADPADALVLVTIYDKDGKFLGAAWVGETMVDAAADYAAAGV